MDEMINQACDWNLTLTIVKDMLLYVCLTIGYGWSLWVVSRRDK